MFQSASDRSKRRKTEHLHEQTSTEELTYAAQMKLRSERQTDTAKVLKDMSSSPTKAKIYRKSMVIPKGNDIFTADEALWLLIELKLSQTRYQQLRNACLKQNNKLFSVIQAN